MSVATETNMVIDKLAEILGSTSGEIITKYTSAMVVEGIVDIILSLVLMVATVILYKAVKKCVTKIDNDNEEVVWIAGTVFGSIVAVIAGIFSLCFLHDGVVRLFAPEAYAIKELIEQVSAI